MTTKTISSPFPPTLLRTFSPTPKRRSSKLRREKPSPEKQKKSRIMSRKFPNVILETPRIFPHSYVSNRSTEETSIPISSTICSEGFWWSKIMARSSRKFWTGIIQFYNLMSLWRSWTGKLKNCALTWACRRWQRCSRDKNTETESTSKHW